jgi:twitching motility protein PilT
VMALGRGMETFNGALTSLFERGLITHETGAAYATSPDEFRLATLGMGRSASVAGDDDDALGDDAAGPVDMHALLTLAMTSGASDLHLVAGRRPMFRIAGRLTPLDGGPKPLSPAVVRRLLTSVFTHAQRERFDLEHELDFALTVTGGHRFRVNAHMQRGTAAAAIRLIPSQVPKVGALGLPPIVFDIATRHQGLVLVTGPTGSGKSTTLAAVIDLINETRNCHVITIEDPIEFVHEDRAATIEQRELGPDTASFAAALKYILRQDPDVILVGELRDQETIAAALTAAETGHLVLATLHANDAPQTIDRIVDIFPPHQQQQVRVQVASELCAVIAQRLLRRADGQGRVAAFEVMIGTPAVRRLIRDSKAHQLQSAMETAGSDGMITLDKWVMELVRRGIVTRDEGAPYLRTPASQAR